MKPTAGTSVNKGMLTSGRERREETRTRDKEGHEGSIVPVGGVADRSHPRLGRHYALGALLRRVSGDLGNLGLVRGGCLGWSGVEAGLSW